LGGRLIVGFTALEDADSGVESEIESGESVYGWGRMMFPVYSTKLLWANAQECTRMQPVPKKQIQPWQFGHPKSEVAD